MFSKRLKIHNSLWQKFEKLYYKLNICKVKYQLEVKKSTAVKSNTENDIRGNNDLINEHSSFIK